MVQGLLGYVSPVGDVLEFRKRGVNPMNTTEGARPYYGGSGRGHGAGGTILGRVGKPRTSYEEPHKYYDKDTLEIRGILEKALGGKPGSFTKNAFPAGSPEWNISYVRNYGSSAQKQWLDSHEGKYFSSQYVQQHSGKPFEQIPDFATWMQTQIKGFL